MTRLARPCETVTAMREEGRVIVADPSGRAVGSPPLPDLLHPNAGMWTGNETGPKKLVCYHPPAHPPGMRIALWTQGSTVLPAIRQVAQGHTYRGGARPCMRVRSFAGVRRRTRTHPRADPQVTEP